MKGFKDLTVKSLLGKPVRTAILVLLTVLLTLTVLDGSLTESSLETGIDSLEARLGADVMVVPYSATTKQKFENIVLQGSTGYFYMGKNYVDEISRIEGVGEMSEQFYLASASTSCCSIPVQIIGYDPDTDFTITPWVKKSYGKKLDTYDVVVGNDLNAFVGDILYFYGVRVKVAAKLEKTGTSYDTTVFTNADTIKELIRSSLELKMNDFSDVDPDNVVSCVLINVADGYNAEEVTNNINLHVKKVKAIQTKEMISGVSDSLSGVSSVIGILIGAVWVLGAVIMLLAFTMSVNERKKEFAVLRVMGASRGKLASLVIKEALLIGLAGSLLGTLTGLVIMIGFGGLIEQLLGLPFLLPSAGAVIGYAIAAVALTVVTGADAAAVSAFRISRIDTGVILRGDN
ncbi:MAG: FtsX-like permease family protein [Ruminococcus sp.]|nr:FtsX-like permease family protein [Ruminococcus sp.]